MQKKTLKKRPLVEAIFELRWELEEQAPNIKIDPHYKLLVGSFYNKVKKQYSFHEPLPSSNMPDEIVAHIVQHRFRKESRGGWPLIQMGPGIITFNDTEKYQWNVFKRGISFTLESLFDSYPEKLVVSKLTLRFINAIPFEHKDSVFDFLKDKMNVNINLPNGLFKKTGIKYLPKTYDIKFAFPSIELNGEIFLRFVKGKSKGIDALIWETVFDSSKESTPQNKEQISRWVQSAHGLIEKWFLTLTEGSLLKSFKG